MLFDKETEKKYNFILEQLIYDGNDTFAKLLAILKEGLEASEKENEKLRNEISKIKDSGWVVASDELPQYCKILYIAGHYDPGYKYEYSFPKSAYINGDDMQGYFKVISKKDVSINTYLTRSYYLLESLANNKLYWVKSSDIESFETEENLIEKEVIKKKDDRISALELNYALNFL